MKKAAVSWSIPPRGVPVRAPLHPGRLLARTCLAPLSLNQSEAARRHFHEHDPPDEDELREAGQMKYGDPKQ